MIGVTKSCLRKLLYRKTFTQEELRTLVAEVQTRVNNRPLCYVSSERTPIEALTPNHLLYGRIINTMPPLELGEDLDPSYEMDHGLLVKSYSRVSKNIIKFENIFEKEYLTSLRARFYGNDAANNTAPLTVGDIVLLESGPNRERWPLAKVLEQLPDPDGIIRAVRILSRGRETIQSVGKLVPLEVTGPAPLQALVEEVELPDHPEVPEHGLQPHHGLQPQRASARQAIARNRRLQEDGLI